MFLFKTIFVFLEILDSLNERHLQLEELVDPDLTQEVLVLEVLALTQVVLASEVLALTQVVLASEVLVPTREGLVLEVLVLTQVDQDHTLVVQV